MTEAEARRIFHDKLPICDVLGLDVREACIQAGVPPAMVDRIMADHAVKTAATTRCITDPSVMPVGSRPPGAAPGAPAAPSPAGPETGFLCLSQKLTGLPMIVWVFGNGVSEGTPYLRVQSDHAVAPRTDGSARVSIEEEPRQAQGPPLAPHDLAAVRAFIRANRAALTAHWHGAGSQVQLLKRIVRVG